MKELLTPEQFYKEFSMFSVSFSLTLKNPNRATGGWALNSTGNTTIANGERLGDYIKVRDELLMLGD